MNLFLFVLILIYLRRRSCKIVIKWFCDGIMGQTPYGVFMKYFKVRNMMFNVGIVVIAVGC